MKLLLDTHVFIWCNTADRRLDPIQPALADPANEIFVSAVSAWEIAVKRESGRLAFTGSVGESIRVNRFLPLAVTVAHAERAGSLTRHHGDPFDRLLIAQAEIEGMTLATVDRQMAAYGIPIL